jgi:hypothetical protein
MKTVKPNIGLVNSLIRMTCGFTILAWGTSKLVKRPFRNSPLVIIMLGAMKVAEGITRFCPLTYLFEEKFEEMTGDNDTEKQYDDMVNPS